MVERPCLVGIICTDRYDNIVIVSPDRKEILAVGAGNCAPLYVYEFWKDILNKKCKFFLTTKVHFNTYSHLKYARIIDLIEDEYEIKEFANDGRKRPAEPSSDLNRFLKVSKIESKCEYLEKHIKELELKHSLLKKKNQNTEISASQLLTQFAELAEDFIKLERKYDAEVKEHNLLTEDYYEVSRKYNILKEDYYEVSKNK